MEGSYESYNLYPETNEIKECSEFNSLQQF